MKIRHHFCLIKSKKNQFMKPFDLSDRSNEELITMFNQEVHKKGWTSSRPAYLGELHAQFIQRRLNITAIGNAQNISFKDEIVLRDDKVSLKTKKE